jgi:hypothetical protein
VAAALLLTVIAGCGPGPTASPHTSPSATAIGSPGVSTDWEVATIEQPASVTSAPSGAPVFCSPCHPAQADLLFGVVRSPFGLIAVGVERPVPTMAAVWTSPDGGHWSRVNEFPADDGTAALAATADTRRVVIVGADHGGATSWSSTDGRTWTRAPRSTQLGGPDGGTSMLAVTPWHDGFIAAGHRDDPAHGKAAGAVWRSADGIAWRRIVEDQAFAGARIMGLASTDRTIVAVGGTDRDAGPPGVAWTSQDGEHWKRVASASPASGPMRAVTAVGAAFIAVGLNADDTGAAVWSSRDGIEWLAVPEQESFQAHGQPIRMAAVARSANGLVAVGWKSDGGNGSAVVWNSPDGIEWRRTEGVPSFSGAEMDGVTAGPVGLVAVGTSGYPDNDQAQVWIGPK